MERPVTDARFRRLYDEHFPAIRAYCIRRLPGSEVNDAVAEVFAITWRRLDAVPDGGDARLWLFGVARNVVRNTERSLRRRTRLLGRVGLIIPAAPNDPETIVVRRSEDEAALAALAKLCRSDRELLRLSAWEGLSHAEIGSVLGIEPHAVTMRLSRARNRLAAQLRREAAPVAERWIDPLPVKGGGAGD